MTAKKAESGDEAPAEQDDIVLVHSRCEDGKGVNVLRKRGESLEAGQMRPIEEGKPINGEVVTLTPREEAPVLFDVKTEYAPKPTKSAPGPARVSSEQYRSGWDSIWGKKKRNKTLN